MADHSPQDRRTVSSASRPLLGRTERGRRNVSVSGVPDPWKWSCTDGWSDLSGLHADQTFLAGRRIGFDHLGVNRRCPSRDGGDAGVRERPDERHSQ